MVTPFECKKYIWDAQKFVAPNSQEALWDDHIRSRFYFNIQPPSISILEKPWSREALGLWDDWDYKFHYTLSLRWAISPWRSQPWTLQNLVRWLVSSPNARVLISSWCIYNLESVIPKISRAGYLWVDLNLDLLDLKLNGLPAEITQSSPLAWCPTSIHIFLNDVISISWITSKNLSINGYLGCWGISWPLGEISPQYQTKIEMNLISEFIGYLCKHSYIWVSGDEQISGDERMFERRWTNF